MTLAKADFAEPLFEKLGLNKCEAKYVVEAFFDQIRMIQALGGVLKRSESGNFWLRDKPRYLGQNPKTGQGYLFRCVEWSFFMPAKNSSLMSS